MVKIEKILLSTDFSDYSLSAAEYATHLAKVNGAELHLLHVIEKTPPILTIRSLDLSAEKIVSSIQQEAEENLATVISGLEKDSGLKIKGQIARGLDFQEIVGYSEKNDIDMIVLATHGRTGVLHTLLGSVAEKVIRYSKVPVLVITPPSK